MGVQISRNEGSLAITKICSLAHLSEEGIPVVVIAGSGPEKYGKQLKDAGIKGFRGMPVNVVADREAEQAEMDDEVAVGFDEGDMCRP